MFKLPLYKISVPGSSGSLIIITIKTKGKYKFHAYNILLFYILEENYPNNSCITSGQHIKRH
jgi:hypothetical protein